VNIDLPREEWVHVAYVAFAPPKKRVAIYVNGRLIGYQDGVKLSLPMDCIGAREHTVHGMVHECRYWATQRSKQELQENMHELLPPDATQNGLIGWWTFEEGEGRYLFDVTEQRYQSKICGRGTKWVTAEDTELEPPTPAWRERSACKVEIRRAKLAKSGRAMLAEADCPQNCGLKVMKKDLKFHMKYVCPKKPSTVPFWLKKGVREKRASLAAEGRLQEEMLECPMGCDEMVKKNNLSNHLKNYCEYRLAPCKNPGCGMSVPICRLEAHENFFCEVSEWYNRYKSKARKFSGSNTPWVAVPRF